jgi:hypothetical protein
VNKGGRGEKGERKENIYSKAAYLTLLATSISREV